MSLDKQSVDYMKQALSAINLVEEPVTYQEYLNKQTEDGHTDTDSMQAKTAQIAKDAMALYQMFKNNPGDEEIMTWITNKLAVAADKIQAVKNYLQNPTATVEIWFPYFDIENGIYNFDQSSSVNDFSISVKSNLVFDSLSSNRYNIISSFETLASSNLSGFSNSFSYNVNTAILKVENVDNQNSSVKYHVEMANGNIIKGAYIGQLEKFKYRSTEGDCD